MKHNPQGSKVWNDRMGFPKIRGTRLRDPTTRTVVIYLGVHIKVPPIYGKYHIYTVKVLNNSYHYKDPKVYDDCRLDFWGTASRPEKCRPHTTGV